MKVLQLRPRLAAQLFNNQTPGLAISRQSVGLAATLIQRKDELRLEVFPERVQGHEDLQFPDCILSVTQVEIRVDPHLQSV